MVTLSLVKRLFKIVMETRRRNAFFARQKNTFQINSAEVKKANKLGFTADEYMIYELAHNDPKEYLSEYERFLFREAVRDYRILLDNKIVFYNLIRSVADTNAIFAYKNAGVFCALVNEFDEQNIIAKLKELGTIVYKENNAGGGNGFRLLEYSADGYRINRVKVEEKDILELLQKDDYLLEEFCNQGRFENSLWPFSVNTVRIITLNYHGDIHIVAAFQRMGLDKDKCVDNANAGGLYALIDLKTGRMSAARSHSAINLLNEAGEAKLFMAHPITNAQIEGIEIPNWAGLCKEIADLHCKLGYTGIEFIAWDIALLDKGFKIIEANTSCSMDLLQTFSGARNGLIGTWMKEKGYIA